jgi:hypothetical protein
MSHPINDAAAEAGAQIGSFDPQNLVEIRKFTRSTPDQLGAMADGFTAAANRLAETPAGGALAEPYAQLGAHLRALASNSGELSGQLAAYNAADFDRIDNPRPGEDMADYGKNQAG